MAWVEVVSVKLEYLLVHKLAAKLPIKLIGNNSQMLFVEGSYKHIGLGVTNVDKKDFMGFL